MSILFFLPVYFLFLFTFDLITLLILNFDIIFNIMIKIKIGRNKYLKNKIIIPKKKDKYISDLKEVRKLFILK